MPAASLAELGQSRDCSPMEKPHTQLLPAAAFDAQMQICVRRFASLGQRLHDNHQYSELPPGWTLWLSQWELLLAT